MSRFTKPAAVSTLSEVLVTYGADHSFYPGLDTTQAVVSVTPCKGSVYCGGAVRYSVGLLRDTFNEFNYCGNGWVDYVYLSEQSNGKLSVAISA
jgi:hypothetical protein